MCGGLCGGGDRDKLPRRADQIKKARAAKAKAREAKTNIIEKVDKKQAAAEGQGLAARLSGAQKGQENVGIFVYGRRVTGGLCPQMEKTKWKKTTMHEPHDFCLHVSGWAWEREV